MGKREFVSLTDDEVKQIVKDIFSAEKVTCIKRYKRDGEIHCKMYTNWGSFDDNGQKVEETIPDDIVLKNPFDYGEYSIKVPFTTTNTDYDKLKQFCFAKGIYGKSIDWLINNPYLKEPVVKE